MAGVFRSERPGLVAGAAGQPVAKMNGCRRVAGPPKETREDTARGTEPGLQAPWHCYLNQAASVAVATDPVSLALASI